MLLEEMEEFWNLENKNAKSVFYTKILSSRVKRKDRVRRSVLINRIIIIRPSIRSIEIWIEQKLYRHLNVSQKCQLRNSETVSISIETVIKNSTRKQSIEIKVTAIYDIWRYRHGACYLPIYFHKNSVENVEG